MAQSVFISYSHADNEIAQAVCAGLEQRGIACWIAPRNILPGADWGASIIDAIDGARVMVLVFSAASNRSHQVRREVERAVAKDVTIIPFKVQQIPLGKTLEYFLATTHWLDASTPPHAQHIARLGDGIEALLSSASRDTTGAIEAMKLLSPPPLLRLRAAPALPPLAIPAAPAPSPTPPATSKGTRLAIGAALAAALILFLALRGGPQILAVDFPPVISASGDNVTGSIQFKAGSRDLVGARFSVVEAVSFTPFDVRLASPARKEGRLGFLIHSTAVQRVTLEVRLVDAAGRQSSPHRFAFEARKGAAGRFQIDTPHFKVRVP